MRALVYTSPGEVQVRDEPSPRARPGEELLTVLASGICGSELHGFRTPGLRVPPLIMGHEFVGTTADGRRVAVNPLLACGACDSCTAGRPQVCRRRGLLGVHRPGGFAEQVAVPRAALHELPGTLSDTAGALIEPLANAVHAWSLLAGGGARVAVLGAGPIGLLCALLGARRGCTVQISDLSEHRRTAARRLGLETVAALDGDYDAVIDAVGVPLTRQAALEHTRPAGTAVWIGLAQDTVEISGNALVRAEQTIRGSFGYTPAEFASAVTLAQSLDLTWTAAVRLEDAADVFYSLAAGNTEIVKAVIVPGRT